MKRFIKIGNPHSGTVLASSYEEAAKLLGTFDFLVAMPEIDDSATKKDKVQYYSYCLGVAKQPAYRTERDSQSRISHFCADKMEYTEESLEQCISLPVKNVARKIMYHATRHEFGCKKWYLRALFGENTHKYDLVCNK